MLEEEKSFVILRLDLSLLVSLWLWTSQGYFFFFFLLPEDWTCSERNTPEYFKLFSFLSPIWNWIFFLLYLWETYGAPEDKSHNIVGWVSLEFWIFNIGQTESPEICQLQFGIFNLQSDFWDCFQLWVSSILGSVMCSVSCHLLQIQEELLIFQSVQIFIC